MNCVTPKLAAVAQHALVWDLWAAGLLHDPLRRRPPPEALGLGVTVAIRETPALLEDDVALIGLRGSALPRHCPSLLLAHSSPLGCQRSRGRRGGSARCRTLRVRRPLA